MGISGLLPTLKSIITPIHVREYAGLKVAIDTYSWLHKAAFTCARDLCEGRPTDKFIQYCMHRVNLLRHHGVQPLLVFDGGVLPMKMDQEEKRARLRKENLQRAQEHERAGNHAAAFECYQRAIDITPVTALRLIKVLQQEGVEYIVAPYEADAQMAYLALKGLVQVVITEDSDLIAYGCPRVLFKMDKSGHGEEFQCSDIVRNKDLNFTNFTKQMVLEMCIMSGCDYLPSLPGMGVKKAHGLIRRFKSYQKVIRHLRFSGITIPSGYEEHFGRAILTFRHQRVYNPVSEEMVHVTNVPSDEASDLEFLGPYLPQTLMKAIAVGKVDPCTKLPFQEEVEHMEVESSSYKSFAQQRSFKRSPVLLVEKNVMTNYFFSPSKEAKKQFKAPRSVPQVVGEATKKDSAKSSTDTKDEFFKSLKTGFSPPDLSTVFGSPLPDDDEDGIDLGATHLADGKSAILEQQNKTGARWGSFKDLPSSDLKAFIGIRGHNDRLDRVFRNAEGSVDHTFGPRNCGLPTSDAERLPLKERKTQYVAPQLTVSEYFSNKRMLQSSLVRLDTEESAAVSSEVSEEDADGGCEKVMKKSRVDFSEFVREKVEKSSLPSNSRSQDVSQLAHTRSKSYENPISQEEKKQPSPFSRFSHEGVSSKVEEFASNVAHVGHYARIAENSMERFVKSIATYRCSSKGTRVSGLRAPSKVVPVPQNFKRRTSKGLETLDATLNQFSYKLSSFKPHQPGQTQWPPKRVTNHDVRRQDPVCLDCP